MHFAPIHFAKIGHMNLDVELHKLKFNSGRLSSKETIGSWNTDDTTNFKLNPGKSLGSMAANTVYRIVTVIVSVLITNLISVHVLQLFFIAATAIHDKEYRLRWKCSLQWILHGSA